MNVPVVMTLSIYLLASLYGAACAASDKDCHIGSYRLNDGSTIDVAASVDDTLRWRLFTGETGQLHPQANGTWTSTYGWTDRGDSRTISFSDCSRGEIHFGPVSGKRIAFDVRDTKFEDRGVKLVGRLVLPTGTGKVPVVVLVHGSEHIPPSTPIRYSGCSQRRVSARSSMTNAAPVYRVAPTRRTLTFSPLTPLPR